MLDFQDLYQQRVSRYADTFIKVVLNPLELKYVVDLANKIIEAKKNETAHKKDGASEEKRFVNGLKGEFAVAKYLKMDILNEDIGVSAYFNVPDIPGYGIGIKTVEYGHFPIIPKVNTYPQIICICHPNAADIVYICGLANVDTLNKFQHDDLILDPNLKAKGTKTGFYGFHELEEVTLETMEPYKGLEVEKEVVVEEVKPKRTRKSKKIEPSEDDEDLDDLEDLEDED